MRSSVILLVLLSAGVAFGHGQREVVSYYASGESGLVVIPEVPEGGFVLTDVAASAETRITVFDNGEPKLNLMLGGLAEVESAHFNSGIPFSPGSTVTVTHNLGVSYAITLTGYIPCSRACGGDEPRITKAGVGVLALLASGAFIMGRRKRRAGQ